MKKLRPVTIAYLYPQRMNIYGDWGNIICLSQRLAWRNIAYDLVRIEVGQTLPKQIDLIFIGGGQDKGQVAVAEDLQHKRSQLKEAIEADVPALAICGGYQLFGEYFLSSEYGQLPGIEIFPVVTKSTETRMIGNVVVESSQFGRLVGFENHSGATELFDGATPLGSVRKGYGNNGDDKTEGIIHRNSIGTYLHGSFLPKNPKVADFLLTAALRRQQTDYVLAPLDDWLEHKAADVAGKRPQ